MSAAKLDNMMGLFERNCGQFVDQLISDRHFNNVLVIFTCSWNVVGKL